MGVNPGLFIGQIRSFRFNPNDVFIAKLLIAGKIDTHRVFDRVLKPGVSNDPGLKFGIRILKDRQP